MVNFRYEHYKDILVMMPLLLVGLGVLMFTILAIILNNTKE
jgi:hypothetical protein